MPDPDRSFLVASVLAHTAPVLLLLAALLAGRLTPVGAFRLARVVTAVAFVLALLTTVMLAAFAAAAPWAVAIAALAVLVTGLGCVLVRYAEPYLDGEPGRPRFVRWFCATLAGATMVVAADHLLVLVVAWLGTSLSLQNLLTFYPDRPAAQMAAHKKFLVSRAADIAMLAAAALLFVRHETLSIQALHTIAADGGAAGDGVAMALIAAAVLLKSAQLPFHGWLMQVMEAPTPVSALLHAGVVNLGGVVAIRLAPLFGAAPAAQTMLVVGGAVTAAIAALVATTRISIKVALAWSTCAQMGFMVLQCGLGLYEMAWLHLLAHSLYKAHAFLSAGSVVQQSIAENLLPKPAAPTLRSQLLAATVAVSAVGGAAVALGLLPPDEPAVGVLLLVVALSLTPLLAGAATRGALAAAWLGGVVTAIAVALVYGSLHALLHGWLGQPGPTFVPPPVVLGLTAVVFVGVFVVQAFGRARPHAGAVQWLQQELYGGLFLDEWFTRLTLRIWPVRRPAPALDLGLAPRKDSR